MRTDAFNSQVHGMLTAEGEICRYPMLFNSVDQQIKLLLKMKKLKFATSKHNRHSQHHQV